MDRIRKAAVAGSFYAGDRATLNRDISSFFAASGAPAPMQTKAIICPHAGYVYSGRVAATTMAMVHVPDTVLVIGPNHHGHGRPVALSGADAWDTPLGPVPVEKEVTQALAAASPLFAIDDDAHALEHSLEVQVPLLRYRNPAVAIVPLVVGGVSLDICRQLGEAIAGVLSEVAGEVLIVASTDMTHYLSRAQASRQDQLALEHVKALDWQGLYRTVVAYDISMCGVLPVVITLVAAARLGAVRADLVQYTDSGEVTGDTGHVVAYAGLLVR